jgi:hypothetical protein
MISDQSVVPGPMQALAYSILYMHDREVGWGCALQIIPYRFYIEAGSANKARNPSQ